MLSGFFRQRGVMPFMILLALLLTVFLPQTMAQEDNICRDADAPVIDYGETLTGSVNPSVPFSLFCFDGERGTDVTITISPNSPNLLTGFIVGTPFINSEGTFEDELLLEKLADRAGTAYQATVSITADGTYLILVQSLQDSQGSFSITIEQSGGTILGAAPTEDGNGGTGDETSTGSTGISNIIFGETDLCTTIYSQDVIFGEMVEDSASGAEPLFYCFDAEEGDIITIELTSESDIPMAFLLVDPLFDAAPTTRVYLQEISQVEGETVSDEFIIQNDGSYVIIVLAAIEGDGDFSLMVSSIAGNVYNCQNEPLNTLITRQWGILDTNDVPVIEVNVTCSDILAISTFGGSAIGIYDITQDDEFVFRYQNVVYVTTSLTDEEWVIERTTDGEAFTLQALTDGASCSAGGISTLIQGSWFWEVNRTQQFFLDFTCNGVVIIDDSEQDPITAPYELEDGQLTINLGGQLIVFQAVEITEESLSMRFDGASFELPNLLYDESDIEAEATEESE